MANAKKPLQTAAIRPGAVPTPDGRFPVDVSAGGIRRKRRPLIDLSKPPAPTSQDDAGSLRAALTLLSTAAIGWTAAPDEWRASVDGLLVDAGEAVTDPTEAASASAEAVEEQESAPTSVDDLLQRLAALPEADVRARLGHHWDGDDDSFEAAVRAYWDALNPSLEASDVVPDPPKAPTAKRERGKAKQ